MTNASPEYGFAPWDDLTYAEHPLGFKRGELVRSDCIVRTHAWLEEGYMDTDRHQHGATFGSEPITGEMLEQLFLPELDPEGSHELWPVVCYSDPDGTYHVDAQLDKVIRVTPVLIDEIVHTASEVYTRPWDDYHLARVVKAPLVTMSVWGPEARTRDHFFMRSISHPESLYNLRGPDNYSIMPATHIFFSAARILSRDRKMSIPPNADDLAQVDLYNVEAADWDISKIPASATTGSEVLSTEAVIAQSEVCGKILDALIASPVKTVNLAGEALLADDSCLRLAQALKSAGKIVSLTVNDSEQFENIVTAFPDLPVDSLTFYFGGDTPDRHGAMVKNHDGEPDSLASAFSSYLRIKRKFPDVKYNVVTTINRISAGWFEDLIEFTRHELKAHELIVCQESEPYADDAAKGSDNISKQAFLTTMQLGRQFAGTMPIVALEAGAQNKMTIAVDGTVRISGTAEEIAYGKITEDSFDTIWRRLTHARRNRLNENARQLIVGGVAVEGMPPDPDEMRDMNRRAHYLEEFRRAIVNAEETESDNYSLTKRGYDQAMAGILDPVTAERRWTDMCARVMQLSEARNGYCVPFADEVPRDLLEEASELSDRLYYYLGRGMGVGRMMPDTR